MWNYTEFGELYMFLYSWWRHKSEPNNAEKDEMSVERYESPALKTNNIRLVYYVYLR